MSGPSPTPRHKRSHALRSESLRFSGHACAFERAADALHCTRIDAKPGSDLANALRASRRVQGLAHSVLRLGRYRRPAQPFALALGPRKPGADSFLAQRRSRRPLPRLLGIGTWNGGQLLRTDERASERAPAGELLREALGAEE